jgi:hypothetical protein
MIILLNSLLKKAIDFTKLAMRTSKNHPVITYDQTIRPMNEYRDFIGSLKNYETLTSLLNAAYNQRDTSFYLIGDWELTAQAHQCVFTDNMICDAIHNIPVAPLKIDVIY